MKILALLLAITSAGAVASEVGAPNLQEANGELALATQETGASTSWAVESFENMATSYQVQQLNSSMDKLNAKIANDLESKISSKLRTVAEQ